MKILFLTGFFMLLLTACDQDKTVEVAPKQVLKNAAINPSQDMEVATSYTAEIVPKKMTVQEKKKRFRHLLVPNRKSTRLNSSHGYISYAVFCLKKKTNKQHKNIFIGATENAQVQQPPVVN